MTAHTVLASMSREALVSAFTQREVQLEKAIAERDEAREWAVKSVREVEAQSRITTCVWCGHAFPPTTPTHGAELLFEHAKVCEKHPVHAVTAKLDEARAQVVKLEAALCEVREAGTSLETRALHYKNCPCPPFKCSCGLQSVLDRWAKALSTDAGQSLLDRLHKAEAELSQWPQLDTSQIEARCTTLHLTPERAKELRELADRFVQYISSDMPPALSELIKAARELRHMADVLEQKK